jgi:hypothetical protein
MAVPPPVRKLRSPTNLETGSKSYFLTAASAGLDICAQDTGGKPCRAIQVFGAGNLVVEHPGHYDSAGAQVQVTWTGVTAGAYIPAAVAKIVASGSTATNVLIIW